LKLAIIIGGILFAIAGLASIGDDSSDSPSTPAESEPEKVVAAPDASGRCPGQMFVGIPEVLNFRVKNPGDLTYPATYFGFWDGSGPFVLNSGASDGAPGIPGDYGLQGKGYQFRGTLKPGESRRLRIIVTPKDAGNFDELTMAVWGAKEDGPKILLDEDRYSLFSCEEITINP
jgi:hypothetical protein